MQYFMFFLWVIPSLIHAGVPDTPFTQEYHEPYQLPEGQAGNDVRSVAVDGQGHVWAATQAGIFRLDTAQSQWRQMMPKP